MEREDIIKNNFLTLMLIMVLSFSMVNVTFAADNLDIDDLSYILTNKLSSQEQTYIKQKIANLNDKEFDEFIISALQNTNDINKLIETLSLLGVEVTKPNKKIQLQGVPGRNASVWVVSARRTGESFYRLIGYTSLDFIETRPGSYDVITMYFDSDMTNYYHYNTSDYTDLRSGQYATSGTFVFNLYDKFMGRSTQYGAVYVTPKSNTSGEWLDFGADWAHTFTKTETTSITPTAKITFDGKGKVSGSVGVSVTIDPSVEDKWEKGDTNAVLLR